MFIVILCFLVFCFDFLWLFLIDFGVVLCDFLFNAVLFVLLFLFFVRII